MSGKDLTLNGTTLSSAVPDAIVVKAVRQLVGGVRDIYEEFPGLEGSWRFIEKVGDRHLIATIALISASYTARRTAVKSLADWVDVGASAKLVLSDESDRYWDAKLLTAPDPDEWVNHANIDLEFRVGPYSKAVSSSSAAVTATNNIDFTVAVPDAIEAHPVITITPSSTAATLQLICNGQTLTYSQSVIGGNSITIDSIGYAVLTGANTDTNLDGVFTAANLSMANVDGVFPLLEPGTNTLRIVGANATVSILWRRRFR